MKKLYLFSALFLSFCLFAACFAPLVETGERVSEDVFRLHILANSDTKADQDLKLLVRDDVLQACTFFSHCQSVTEAQQAAENNLQRITRSLASGFDRRATITKSPPASCGSISIRGCMRM